ncbi:TPA: hypothetical protein HA239_01255 [Candidatus Woesearchaeota archaeon]|nr:hypothetical protein QT06_C0001G0417 [archaeon GW2011_AR15]MBS3103729.1 hypothetical protein [Candidatus Woesearchaeota archaeon]HIH41020.1 hypothetical protein [Candidatus Woesearchaeota archaeon]
MLFATLGKLDLITVLILLGAAILPSKLLMYAALYLIVKGGLFVLMNRDLASYGDLFSGIYILVLSFGIKIPYLHQIVFFWLLQKTILTFIGIGLKLFLFYQESKDGLPFSR